MRVERFLVVGRFRGQKKSDVVDHIRQSGHTVVGTLSRATRVVAGSGADKQTEDALARGIQVLTLEELEALLPPPEVAAGEPEVAVGPAVRLHRPSAEEQLRWVMDRGYDSRSWGLLTTALERFSGQGLADAVSAVEAQVATWPAHERYTSSKWLVALAGGLVDPRLRLAGNLLMNEFANQGAEDVRRVLWARAEQMPQVRQIRFSHLSGNKSWLDLLEPGMFSGITEFDFMYNSLGVKGLEKVLAAIPCSEATVLDLRSNSLGTEGAKMLAAAGLERLEWLHLYQNDIKDAGVAALCAPGVLPALRHLSVEYNGLSAKSGAALAKAPFASRLVTLKVKYNSFLAAGAQALAKGPLSSLERLDISANEIGDEGLAALARSPHLSRLERLDIEGNSAQPLITDVGLQALAESPQLPALRTLRVQLNQITSAGLEALLTAPSRTALKDLGIENNHLDAGQLDVLTRAGLPVRLERLRINFQGGDTDVFYRTLAAACALAGLEGLFIAPPWSVREKPGTALALLESPHLTSLRSLELWDCALNTEAVARLVAYPFTGLRKLSTYNAHLTRNHYRLLATAHWLPQLEELTFSDYPKIEDFSALAACFKGTPVFFYAR